MDLSVFEGQLEKIMEAENLPGISAALSVDGDMKYRGGKGYSDLRTRTPATETTVYPIASITKTMTAHILLNALASKGIPADTCIRDVEPRFALNHPTAGTTLTFEQLIHHFGPLPSHLLAWQFNDTDRETFLFERLPHLPCYADPVPQYRYSNILYALGGWIAGSLMDSTWEDLFLDTLVKNLHLRHTSFFDETWQDRLDLAKPHTSLNGETVQTFYAPGANEHIIAPASEVLSSVVDLHQWATFALKNRLWDLLPDTSTGTASKKFTVQAGWRRSIDTKEETLWHSGQCRGYTSLLFIIPAHSLTCVLLTNKDGAVSTLINIMKSFAGSTPSSPAQVEEKTPIPASPPSAPVHQPIPFPAEGFYWNPGYGEVEIKKNSKGEKILTLQGNIQGPLCTDDEHTPFWQPEGGINRFKFNYSSKYLSAIELFLTSGTPPIVFQYKK